jgi:hypothetical protein
MNKPICYNSTHSIYPWANWGEWALEYVIGVTLWLHQPPPITLHPPNSVRNIQPWAIFWIKLASLGLMLQNLEKYTRMQTYCFVHHHSRLKIFRYTLTQTNDFLISNCSYIYYIQLDASSNPKIWTRLRPQFLYNLVNSLVIKRWDREINIQLS